MMPIFNDVGYGSSEKRPRRSRRGRWRGGGVGDADVNPTLDLAVVTEKKPCTEYDVAYFNSYAHLGIHEEMIKVFVLLFTVMLCYKHFCSSLNAEYFNNNFFVVIMNLSDAGSSSD